MRRRTGGVLAVLVAALALTGCGGDDSAEAARELRRRTAGAELEIAGIPEDGVLLGNTVELELSGAGVRIVEPDGDTSGRTGHYAVFVDREPVALGEEIPEDDDVIEASESPVEITGLLPGPHEVVVVLADGRSRRIGENAARAEMEVRGPSVQASAAPSTEPDQPVVVSIEVEGVQVAQPAGDTSGATGHFALFVDREPTAAGEPVPEERGILHTADQVVAVPDLGSGEHFVWVVLLKGDKTPFDPLVADKVEFEVG